MALWLQNRHGEAQRNVTGQPRMTASETRYIACAIPALPYILYPIQIPNPDDERWQLCHFKRALALCMPRDGRAHILPSRSIGKVHRYV